MMLHYSIILATKVNKKINANLLMELKRRQQPELEWIITIKKSKCGISVNMVLRLFENVLFS